MHLQQQHNVCEPEVEVERVVGLYLQHKYCTDMIKEQNHKKWHTSLVCYVQVTVEITRVGNKTMDCF